MRKKFGIILLCFSMILSLCSCGSAETAGSVKVSEFSEEKSNQVDSQITISTTEFMNEDFRGFGVQWDPHAESFVPDSDWELLLERVSYLSPEIVRCMVLARWYIASVEDGEPVLNFDNYEMRQAMKVLDYCQTNEIPVVWGDWGPPTNLGLKFTDEAWAKGMAGCIDYLRNEKGYTCIQYCNIGNEPDGDWSDCGNFDVYKVAVENLYSEMSKLNLLNEVAISGPDVYGDWNWIDRSLETLDDKLDNFDFHWYSDAVNVASGNIEIRLRRKLKNISEQMGERKIFINEIGLSDGKNSMDQQPNVRLFWYGVSMVDYMVQCARGGIDAVIAWDLEDSMHPSGNEYKTWGFYNMKGDEEERKLRPWFYSYSLLCRLFPQGCNILQAENNGENGIRVLAMKDAENNISIAIVNNNSEPTSFLLQADIEQVVEKLYQYNYFETDRPVDDNGFPVTSNMLRNVDLAEGIIVEMPADGVVYFSTIDK